MAENSKIEWTDHTVNLWWGCTKVHEGCDNCYAETTSARYGNDVWGNDKPRKKVNSSFGDLAKFNKQAAKLGEIQSVFIGSMMDIFEKPMDMIGNGGLELNVQTEEKRWVLFREIGLGSYPNLRFLFLTKRPSNINKMIPESWLTKAPDNVWFGASVVNQGTFDTLVPQLLKVNHENLFLSMEPQLAPIDIMPIMSRDNTTSIKWIIQGGESGPGRRPFNTNWAVSMRLQCELMEIAYFFKQIDKVIPVPDHLKVLQYPFTKKPINYIQ